MIARAGIILEVVVDVGDTACYYSNRPLSYPYLFSS